MMLVFETSGTKGSVAIRRGDGRIIEARMGEPLCHARDLLALAEELLGGEGLDVGDVTGVGVSTGPGSYTGMRVGIAAAKVLAWALSVPLVGVGSLDVLARGVPGYHRTVAAAIDAKRGRVYWAVYERQGEELVTRIEAAAGEATTAAALLPTGAVLVGTGAPALSACARGKGWIALGKELWEPRAGVLAEIATEKLLRGETSSPLELGPTYLGRSEAEELWERRHAAGRDRDARRCG